MQIYSSCDYGSHLPPVLRPSSWMKHLHELGISFPSNFSYKLAKRGRFESVFTRRNVPTSFENEPINQGVRDYCESTRMRLESRQDIITETRLLRVHPFMNLIFIFPNLWTHIPKSNISCICRVTNLKNFLFFFFSFFF